MARSSFRIVQLGSFHPESAGSAAHTQPRTVEPTHHGVWRSGHAGPAQTATHPTPQTETGATPRGSDSVEFSDYLHRMNRENALRELRCEQGTPTEADACKPALPSGTSPQHAPTPGIDPMSPTDLPKLDTKHQIVHRSATGRLIDMLM